MALFGTTGAEEALTVVIKARDEASAQIQRIEQQAKKFRETNREMLRDLQRGSGLVSAAFGFLGGIGVNTARQLETAEIGLKTLLGSAQEAAGTVERVKLEAARTPFEIAGLTRATQLLSSVTHDGDQAIDILLDVGEALSAMGKGQSELDRIIVNLQQVAATGRAMMIDIRQFAFAGIPIFEMLQKETGLAGDALGDFISEGGVTFELLTEMFRKATEEGGRFFGAFENATGSFDQTVSNLQDTISTFLSEVVEETGIFDFLKQVMRGTTEWIDTNKELAKVLFVTTGALAGTTFALSTLGLILPKVMKFLRVGFGLAAAHPIILAVTSAIVFITGKLAQFGEEVGGFGVAWKLTVKQMEVFFMQFVRGVLKGINLVAQFIPSLNDAVEGAIDGLTGKIDEANAELSELALEGMETVRAKSKEAGESAADAFDSVGDAAKGAADEVRKANNAIAETESKIAELQKKSAREVSDARADLARAYVDQEERVARLREDIAREHDQKRIAELQAQLTKESEALERAGQLQIGLTQDINEARRRASLTDFEREVEDIRARLAERAIELNEKMAMLREELAQREAARDKITELEQATTESIIEEVKKRKNETVSAIDTQVQKYRELAEAAARAARARTESIASFAIGGVSTPAVLPRFALGGEVSGPRGMPRLAVVHGGERVIPAGEKQSGGNTFQITQNFNVTNESDIPKIRREMERFFRQVAINHKLAV